MSCIFVVTTESCHGAIVRNRTNQTIVDANNETWTIDNRQKITKSGVDAAYTDSVMQLVYWDKVIYQENYENKWWKWINSDWTEEKQENLTSKLALALGCENTFI